MFKSARGPFKLQTKNKRQDGHPQISPNLTKSRAIRGSWTRFGFTVGVNGLLAGAASHCKSLYICTGIVDIYFYHVYALSNKIYVKLKKGPTNLSTKHLALNACEA